MRSLEIFIQSVPARYGRCVQLANELLRVELGAILLRITVFQQRDDQTVREFFLSILDAMTSSYAEYVLRLEDDVLLNRHLFHNVATWPALRAERFGCGWLWCSEIFMKERTSYQIEEPEPGLFEVTKPIWGSLGALFPTDHMSAIRARAEHPALLPGAHGKSQDSALSGAVLLAGLRVFLHVPSLLEHDVSVKSAFGHKFVPGYGQAGPLFDPDWKRTC